MLALDYLSYWPQPKLVLKGEDVHVWIVSLEQPTFQIRSLLSSLPPEEQSRAQRFRFERDQRRFTVSHSALRTILSYYIEIKPNQIRFRYKSNGKPYLSEELDGNNIQFNMAHSQELALYALTFGREVGVDLEYIRPLPDAEQIARRFFSQYENSTLREISDGNQKLEAFFNCWTRKEAYMKAIGDGLAYPLDQFDVSLAPGEPARLLHVKGYPKEPARWSLKTFIPAAGYIAALAAEGFNWQFLPITLSTP